MKELTTEELEQLAKQTTTEKAVKLNPTEKSMAHVKKFVNELNIKEGSCEVPNYVLYYKYCREWLPGGQKLSKIGFLRTFAKFFEAKRKTNRRYYNLNIQVTDEYTKEAKDYDKQYGKYKKTRRKL